MKDLKMMHPLSVWAMALAVAIALTSLCLWVLGLLG